MTAITDAQLKIDLDATIFPNGVGAINATADNSLRTDYIDSKKEIEKA